MARVREIVDRIYEIFPDDLTNGVVCLCYLVVGEQAALIETGSTSQVDEILKGMDKLGYGPHSLSYIIPTHIHVDHGGGAGYLAAKASRAKVVAHPKGAPHLIDPSKLMAGSGRVFGSDFEVYFGSIQPVAEAQALVVEDGETLSLGGRDLRILYTPGHCADHLSIYDSRSKGLFCGEALGGYMPQQEDVVLAVSPPVFMLDAALASVEKIRKLDLSHLFYSQWGQSDAPEMLLDRIEEKMKLCAKTVMEGLGAGESDEAIEQRALPYLEFEDNYYIASEGLRKCFKAFGVGPLIEYFRKFGGI
jgi:glyoxylase-like metal-dependent hydrolase (beta-lactamase superfamily II)